MRTEPMSEVVAYGPIIQRAFRKLAERPHRHADLVQTLVRTPTTKNSATKVVRWLERNGQIVRDGPQDPWRLPQ